jgi:hypothetical protein
MKPPLEKAIQRQMLDWLKIMGFRAWRQNSGSMPTEYKGKTRFIRFNTQDGLSDIGGWVPAKKMNSTWSVPLYIEVKRPGNKASPLQQYFIDCVNKDGGIGLVATSLDEMISGLTSRGVVIDG